MSPSGGHKGGKGDKNLGARSVLDKSREDMRVLWPSPSRGDWEDGAVIRERECQREKLVGDYLVGGSEVKEEETRTTKMTVNYYVELSKLVSSPLLLLTAGVY